MDDAAKVLLDETNRSRFLLELFPGECTVIGPKNLKKITQDTKPQLLETQLGSNVMFGELIVMLMQALEFADNFISVYQYLRKEESKPAVQNVINITINNYQVDAPRLNEEKMKKIAEYCIELLKSNDGS